MNVAVQLDQYRRSGGMWRGGRGYGGCSARDPAVSLKCVVQNVDSSVAVSYGGGAGERCDEHGSLRLAAALQDVAVQQASALDCSKARVRGQR